MEDLPLGRIAALVPEFEPALGENTDDDRALVAVHYSTTVVSKINKPHLRLLSYQL